MKKLLPLLAALLLAPAAHAADYDNLTCSFHDKNPDDADRRTKGKFQGKLKVNGDTAHLEVTAVIHFLDKEACDEGEPKVAFTVGKLKNVKYSGTKYKNHFKFEPKWEGVDADVEWANLIISKEPVSVKKDAHGATLRTFDAVLDASYDDHHGDYIRVQCVNRSFEDR